MNTPEISHPVELETDSRHKSARVSGVIMTKTSYIFGSGRHLQSQRVGAPVHNHKGHDAVEKQESFYIKKRKSFEESWASGVNITGSATFVKNLSGEEAPVRRLIYS